MRTHCAAKIITAWITFAVAVFFILAPTSEVMAKNYYAHQNLSSPEFVVNAVPVGKARSNEAGEASVTIRESHGNDLGFAVPDINGNLIWTPIPNQGQNPIPAEARELRLKVRELADQMLVGVDPVYSAHVAVPTTFVNQENFGQTSTLGRFIAEQLLHELSQRGFPVREYRLGKAVRSNGREGDFLLEHTRRSLSAKQPGVLFVVGTYLVDRQAIFINARLVGGNGDIIRTAQLLMPNSSLTRRMLVGGTNAGTTTANTNQKRGWLPVEDFKTVTRPVNVTPFEQGEDIH